MTELVGWWRYRSGRSTARRRAICLQEARGTRRRGASVTGIIFTGIFSLVALQEKVEAWAKGNWLSEAQARLAQYKSNGPSGPASWVLTQGKSIPKGALEVGPENSWMLYICRAAYDVSHFVWLIVT